MASFAEQTLSGLYKPWLQCPQDIHKVHKIRKIHKVDMVYKEYNISLVNVGKLPRKRIHKVPTRPCIGTCSDCIFFVYENMTGAKRTFLCKKLPPFILV